MSMSVLQQSLPFTVLKHFIATLHAVGKFNALQQSLPFTVLKLSLHKKLHAFDNDAGCNSPYRLRY